jgi:hypothetical protein
MKVRGQHHSTVAVHQGKRPWKLGGNHSRYEHGGEEKNPQSLPEIEPTIFQPVA